MEERALTDDAFIRLVLSGRIERFGHREHLRLTFLAARGAGTVDEVVARCRAGIQAVAGARSAAGRYHETITSAWAAIMFDATARAPGVPFDELVERHPSLTEPGYLERHYSPGRLASAEARAHRLEPDRTALPGPPAAPAAPGSRAVT